LRSKGHPPGECSDKVSYNISNIQVRITLQAPEAGCGQFSFPNSQPKNSIIREIYRVLIIWTIGKFIFGDTYKEFGVGEKLPACWGYIE
jgi:hypothetical protein